VSVDDLREEDHVLEVAGTDFPAPIEVRRNELDQIGFGSGVPSESSTVREHEA
jgi:hypothetical protein